MKSARKLPWSDGGKHSPGNPTLSDSSQPVHSVLENTCEIHLPSVNTPDRAETFKKIKVKNSAVNILGKGSFGTVVAASYRGMSKENCTVLCILSCFKSFILH